jgi:sulfide:quinone oxidoreductase
MEKTHFDTMLKEMDKDLKKHGLSRRDALKIAGITGAGFMLAPTDSKAATKAIASNAKGKIVIVGAGAAGITVAAQLANKLSDPDVTIIAPNETHLYQPGQTMIAGGIWKTSDIQEKTADYMPSGVKWVKDKVAEYDAEGNSVKTEKGQTIKYDYLVIATGIEYAYERIEGLTTDKLGKDGTTSLYWNNLDNGTVEGCEDTWKELQAFAEKSKSGKVVGLFTHPNTPIKCGGAPKKIMYLTEHYLRKHGNRANAELVFLPNGGKMFGVKEYHDAIVNQYKARNMKWQYKHNLVKIDTDKKVATFAHSYKVKGAWDADLGEYEEITKVDHIEMNYDFIHITPPMKAPDSVKNSPFSWKKGSAGDFGALEVNQETLQHPNYKNVFGLGDVAGIPMGKTGGSVRKQAPVLVDNLIATMEGKSPAAKYAGYTVCPLITGYGTVMLAEFDWSKKPTPSFPLDPSVERWIWWIMKAYMLKPMYFMGMLKGRA